MCEQVGGAAGWGTGANPAPSNPPVRVAPGVWGAAWRARSSER